MTKDWVGNGKSVFVCNGATNHSEGEREANDYYATEPKAVELLLQEETFSKHIWEPACGEGHMSEVLKAHGYDVLSTDLIDRGYGIGGVNFFNVTREDLIAGCSSDIITNPPYKYAKEFVEHALDISNVGAKVAMFLKLTFLEGKKRRLLFDKSPPRTVYVSTSRLQCAKNGDFDTYKESGATAVAYAWFVWEKGYKGETTLRWI